MSESSTGPARATSRGAEDGAATWDTARCLQKRWNFYHGGVLLLLYVDLMVLLMISFLLLAPLAWRHG